jgi:hypothetical protein
MENSKADSLEPVTTDRDGYSITENASLERKVSKYKPDGSLNFEEPIGDEFDEVLDQLNDCATGRNKSLPRNRHGNPDDPIADARQEEEVARWLNQFQFNLHKGLQERLGGAGIEIQGVGRNEHGFVVAFTDRQQRNYPAIKLTVDEAMGFMGLREEGAFNELLDQVCKKILACRDAAFNAIEQGVKRFMGGN